MGELVCQRLQWKLIPKSLIIQIQHWSRLQADNIAEECILVIFIKIMYCFKYRLEAITFSLTHAHVSIFYLYSMRRWIFKRELGVTDHQQILLNVQTWHSSQHFENCSHQVFLLLKWEVKITVFPVRPSIFLLWLWLHMSKISWCIFVTEKTNVHWSEFTAKGKQSTYNLPRKIFLYIQNINIYIDQCWTMQHIVHVTAVPVKKYSNIFSTKS